MRRPRALLSFALLPALLCLDHCPAQGGHLPDDRARGAASVTIDEARAWLGTLASEEFGGRGTGQPGFELAANFVAKHFEQLGLEPRGDAGTYLQRVPWGTVEVDTAASSVVFTAGDRKVEIPGARLGGRASGDVAATGGVVAIRGAPALDDVDLTDKVVLFLLDRVDGRAQFQAMRALQGKQVAATLFATSAPVGGGLRGTSGGRGSRALRGRGMSPATIAFGGDDLAALLELCGEPDLAGRAGVHRLDVEATVTVRTAAGVAPAFNVVGVLPGADPARRGEYVVIGSHLDHLGRRGERYFPGADDDGSGTTGVMAAAKMFAENPLRPARSVLFVCFCGEESGLVGSRHFAENPPIDLAAIVGELQMDMIGRSEEEARDGRRTVNIGETADDNRNSLHLVGTQKLAPAMHELCLQRNEHAGFDLEFDQESLFGRSDHANFAAHGVPIAFFFTGIHKDYHQVTDTPDKIEYDKLLRVARYVYDIAFELAQRDDRPRVDPALWAALRNKRRAEPAAPMVGDDR